MDHLQKARSALMTVSGASNLLDGGKQVVANSRAGGTWSGMAKGFATMAGGALPAVAAMFYAPVAATAVVAAAAIGLSVLPKTREATGSAIKKTGKTIGNQRMIEDGRNIQYGHLPPEKLLVEHPSAFMRTYAFESDIQFSGAPGGPSKKRMNFKISEIQGSAREQQHKIVDSTGVSRNAPRIFQLEKASTFDPSDRPRLSTAKVEGGFIPMLQADTDKLPKNDKRKKAHIAQSEIGALDTSQNRRKGKVAFTTDLSGCSVTRIESELVHVRPKSDGKRLNQSLKADRTFGRKDYPGQVATVMTKGKPDGSTRLYYQIKDTAANITKSGRKDLGKG
jgi:hypothetical protein